MSLVICAGCSRHIKRSESRCPFCSVSQDGAHSPERAFPAARLGRAALAAFAAATVGSGCGGKAVEQSPGTGGAVGNGGAANTAGSGAGAAGKPGTGGFKGTGGAPGTGGLLNTGGYVPLPPYGSLPISRAAHRAQPGDVRQILWTLLCRTPRRVPTPRRRDSTVSTTSRAERPLAAARLPFRIARASRTVTPATSCVPPPHSFCSCSCQMQQWLCAC